MPKVSIILPCFNVENNIPVTSKVLIEAERLYPPDVSFEYVFVDDGSKDKTYSELKKVLAKHSGVKIVKLSRNFGSNNAALAGLNHATGDCISIIAADLQDPPELISEMFEFWRKGIKLVVANRKNREESPFRVFAANIYHYLMRKSIPYAPEGGFDLVLFDSSIKNQLVEMNEHNTYLPYQLMWLGYEYVNIPYTRRKREIGHSMWTFSKKVKSAIDSIVSFSFSPIRMISITGFFLGAISLTYLLLIIWRKFADPASVVEGWASGMVIFLGVSSFQMISMGVIGEYLWRALDSTRNRPNFIVDRVDQ